MVCLMIMLICSALRFSSVSAEDITGYSGQNVTLNCTTENKPVAVEWRRTDLEDEFVLLYRDNRIDSSIQHPDYKNRVDLADRQMKDGDVSLVLMNATTNDNGTYQCRVQNQINRHPKLIRTFNLTVSALPPPGDKKSENQDGSVGLIVGLIVSLLLVVVVVVVVVVFLIYRKRFPCLQQKTSDPPVNL